MDIDEGRVGAVREATMSIPPHHLSALRLGREALGPALVHSVPDVVVDRDGDGGVTGDPSHGLAVDQSMTLEVTGEGRGFARVLEQGGHRDVYDDQEGIRVVSVPADERICFHEGVAATLVPGCLTIGGDLVGPGLNTGPGFCVGLVRQLDGDGAALVVEAQKATIVIGRGRGRRSGLLGGRAGNVGEVAHRMLLGLVAEFAVGLGRRHIGDTRTLSKEISPAHSDPMRSGMSQALLPTCVRARAVAVETP